MGTNNCCESRDSVYKNKYISYFIQKNCKLVLTVNRRKWINSGLYPI